MRNPNPQERGESDYIHADFPEITHRDTLLGALAALDVLAMPGSRMAKRGRAWVLATYSVTETDIERYQSL